MRSIRSTLGGVIAGVVVLFAGCVSAAAADPRGAWAPGLPSMGLLSASELSDDLASVGAQAVRGTSPAASSSGFQQELEAFDGVPPDQFGTSVAPSALGDVAIVGAPFHGAGFAGAAYMFVRRGGSWIQRQELQASDGAVGDLFGMSVSLSALGDEAIVGAPGHNGGGGAAYVFVRQGDGWVQRQELHTSDAILGGGFGYSVSLSALGDEAIVGAPGHNGGGGAAYVFVRQGGSWVQRQALQASDAIQLDLFGLSVSLSALGDEAIVGAPGHNGTGAGYVFVRHGGSWIQRQELQSPDGAQDDDFGYSVSLNALGDEAIVGAPGLGQGHLGKGAAYVFARQGGSWVQRQQLQASDATSIDLSGLSVSLSALGDEAIVGAPGHNGTGAGYVFVRHGGSWIQRQELQASDGTPTDEFGFSVSLSARGDQAIVGAPARNDAKGAAYAFKGL